MPAGLEGPGPALGGAVGALPKIEGGLGAGASAMGRMEGLGGLAAPKVPEIANMPPPEIGHIGIGNLSPEAGLAANLEAKLGTPDIGIKEISDVKIAEVKTPDVVPAGLDLNAPKIEVPPPRAEDLGVAQQVDKKGGVPPETKGDKSKVGEEGKVEGQKPEGEKPQEGGVKAEGQPPQAEGQDKATKAGAKPEEAATADKKDVKPPEDAAKAKRTQELEEKVKNRTATADELKELRGMKQDPEQHRKDLEQKAIDGTITDQEAEELGRMNIPEDSKNLTPEQQAEQLKKDIDDLGADIMMRLSEGEEVSPEDFKRMQELRLRASHIENGLSPDQAKQAVREALARGYGKESGKVKDIQQKLRELMSMELQMQTIPHTIEELRQQREAAKKEARAKHSEAESSSGENRIRKKQEEYVAYMKVAGIKAQITAVKDMVPRMNARRMQLEQDVRSGLGITGPLMSIVEHAGAIGYSAYTQSTIALGNMVDDE